MLKVKQHTNVKRHKNIALHSVSKYDLYIESILMCESKIDVILLGATQHKDFIFAVYSLFPHDSTEHSCLAVIKHHTITNLSNITRLINNNIVGVST